VKGRGFTGVIREVINNDGFRGFYRGYKLALVTSIPINALYFSSFRVFQRHFSSSPSAAGNGNGGETATESNGKDCSGSSASASNFAADSLAGLSAELLAALFWTPTDVLKQRMQVEATSSHRGNLNRVLHLGKELGVQGLYRGYVLSVFVWGPFSSMYFATYEALRARFARREAPSPPSPQRRFYVSLVSGILAGAAAGAATQPLDCVRTRMQVSARGTEGKGAVRIVHEIVASEGVGALFRGTFARVLWLAPGCGISLAVFETTSLLLSDK